MIFGMGRVGLGAYELLKERGMRVVGLDSDPGEVQRHLAEGRRVVYGDAEDPDLWHRLRLDGLSAVLLEVSLQQRVGPYSHLAWSIHHIRAGCPPSQYPCAWT